MAEHKITFDSELAVLHKLVSTRDFLTLDEKGINSSFFAGRKKRVFEYILSFKTNHKEVPSFSVLATKFPDIINSIENVEIPDAPLSFFCDDLRYVTLWNSISAEVETFIGRGEKLAEDRDHSIIMDAVKGFTKLVSTINREFLKGDSKDLATDAQSRLAAYLKRKEGLDMGLPTGFDELDYISLGVKPTDLWAFIGFTGIGKTQILIIIACALRKAGYKPLLVTKEMLPEQLIMRADAIWNGLDLEKFSLGTLSPEDEQIYIDFINNIENSDNSFPIELATGGVSSIMALIEKHNPDVCLVDGAYLMTGDTDSKDWNKYVDTFRDFKSLTTSLKVPIIVTMQSKENSSKEGLGNIAFAKYIAQDCSAVWGMEKIVEEGTNYTTMKITSFKQRDSGRFGSCTYNWNFNSMDWAMDHYNIPKYDEYLLTKAKEKRENSKKSPKLNTPVSSKKLTFRKAR